MQRVDIMLTPPVVGQTYMVPGIVYKFFDRGGWFPVLGTRHEDREHIGFADYHYHPDWRFMPQWAFLRAHIGFHGVQSIFAQPLCHRPHGSAQPMDHGAVSYRRRLCKRVVPENVVFGTVPAGGQALHRAWAGKDAKRGPHGLICPHRGTVLGSVPENPDGSITCPLHGLKFCARTGKSIPTQPAIAAAN